MTSRHLVLATLTAALAASPVRASAQSAVGILAGNAGRVGGSPRGIDLGLTGELPVQAFRIRAELGFTGIDSTADVPAVAITRTNIGVVRLTSLGAARPFVGAGVGLYRYRMAGQGAREVSGYISGGFEIAGRRRAFTGELRVTSPLDKSSPAAPTHAGLLFGLKRLF